MTSANQAISGTNLGHNSGDKVAHPKPRRSQTASEPPRRLLTHPILIAGVLTAIAILLYAATGTAAPNVPNANQVGSVDPSLNAPDGR